MQEIEPKLITFIKYVRLHVFEEANKWYTASSLSFFLVRRKKKRARMYTRVTEGARRERHEIREVMLLLYLKKQSTHLWRNQGYYRGSTD